MKKKIVGELIEEANDYNGKPEETKEKSKPKSKRPFYPGERVNILKGQFAGYQGIVRGGSDGFVDIKMNQEKMRVSESEIEHADS